MYPEPSDTVSSNFFQTKPDHGRRKQRERIYMICDHALKNNPGDVLQIGCKDGELTRVLCEVAKKNNKTVTCIDPYTKGSDAHTGKEKQSEEYFKFLMNTQSYSDVVHLHMEDSETEMSDALIQLVEYAFVYISGDSGNTEKHSMEIELASAKNKKNGVICLDNIQSANNKKRTSNLDLFEKKINDHQYGYYWNQGIKEGYLLP